MPLASAGVPEQDDGFASVHVVPGSELAEGGSGDRGDGVDVELREPLQPWELGNGDAASSTPSPPACTTHWRSGRPPGTGRIVSLSSTPHMRSGVDFADLHFEHRSYDPQIAYAQSKTANSLFAVAATRRWASEGIIANAVNPGGVATGLQRNFTAQQKESLDAAEAAGVFTYKSIEQGAATSLVAAVAPQFAHTGGHYLDDAQEAYTVSNDADLAQHPHGVKEWALDADDAERLWDVSNDLLFA